MEEIQKPYQMITDFITGRPVPDIGAEGNRQAVERLLVTDKGFGRQAVVVDRELRFTVDGADYRSRIDLIVCHENTPVMAIKCVAGSLGSWEREILAAARLAETSPIPLAVVCDGTDAVVIDAATGNAVGTGLDAIPSAADASRILAHAATRPLDAARRRREKLIFRTFDADNVNIPRNLKGGPSA